MTFMPPVLPLISLSSICQFYMYCVLLLVLPPPPSLLRYLTSVPLLVPAGFWQQPQAGTATCRFLPDAAAIIIHYLRGAWHPVLIVATFNRRWCTLYNYCPAG